MYRNVLIKSNNTIFYLEPYEYVLIICQIIQVYACVCVWCLER